MGYYTRYVGGFDITPPLPWKDVRELGPIIARTHENPAIDLGDLYLVFEECEEDIDDGTVITRTPYSIEPVTEEPYKGYSITQILERLVKTFPNHEFSGSLICYGEESGDISRVVVREGKVVHEGAKLTWPDGSVAPLPGR
jgi:hypothetical protein